MRIVVWSLLAMWAVTASAKASDRLVSKKLSTPEGAVLTIFHAEKDLKSLAGKDILLQAVREDCEKRRLKVDSDVSCFCAVLVVNTPKCLCAKLRGDKAANADDLIAQLLLSSGKKKQPLRRADSDSQDDLIGDDIRLLTEFNRLTAAVTSVPDGLSAAAIKDNARKAADELVRQRVESEKAESSIRDRLEEVEAERKELGDILISREADIKLLEDAMNSLVDNNVQRAEEYANMLKQVAAEEAEKRNLLTALRQMEIDDLAADQDAFQEEMKKLRAEADAEAKKLQGEIEKEEKALSGIHPTEDPKIKDYLAEAMSLQAAVDNARKELERIAAVYLHGKPCDNSLECARSEQCYEQKCMPVEVKTACLDEADCGNGQKCGDDSQCFDVPQGHACSSEDQCGRSMTCSDSLCIEIFFDPTADSRVSCEVNFDCMFGEACIENTCMLLTGKGIERLCKSQEECPNGYLCQSSTCIAGVSDGKPCGADQACGSGMVCSDSNICKRLWGGQSAKVLANSYCTSNSVCGSGLLCTNNKCTPPKEDGCSTANDCGNGFMCDDGICIERDVNCTSNADCGLNSYCYNGTCADSFARGEIVCRGAMNRTCSDSLDCGLHQRCKKRVCAYVKTNATCTTNVDCGNGHTCSNKTCIVIPEEKFCTSANDCGIGYTCDDQICRTAFVVNTADEIRQSCTGDINCLDKQKCVKGTCAALKENSNCTADSDCANSQKCGLDGLCTTFPRLSPCNETRDCGNSYNCVLGQCLSGTCSHDSLVSVETSIATGTPCESGSDCGFYQQCNVSRCAPVAKRQQCLLPSECGNGMTCLSYRCMVIPQGYPCKTDDDCGENQSCDADDKYCVNGFGFSHNNDLESRMENDILMSERWREEFGKMATAMKGKIKSMTETLKTLQNNHSGLGKDLVRNVEGLDLEKTKLAVGRKVLEAEVIRRAEAKMVGDGDGDCVLCKSEEDIRKLLDEVKRLQGELERCVSTPLEYIETCKDDLNYQIDRLNEEINRRRALLEEEVNGLKDRYKQIENELTSCRSRDRGCPKGDEQAFILHLKKISDELYLRQKRNEEDEQLVIYMCLWKYKDAKNIAQVSELMTSFDDGCPKLKEYEDQVEVYNCMCLGWEGVQKIINEAQIRAAKAAAFKEVVNDNMIASIASIGSDVLEQKDEMKVRPNMRFREQSVKVAEEVAKELLWRHMKGRPGFNEILKESVASSQNDGTVQAVSKEEQAKIEMIEGCLNDPSCAGAVSLGRSDVASMDLPKSEIFSEDVFNKCLSDVKEPFVTKNMREAYEKSNSESVCALLSISSASTMTTQGLYSCLCKQ